MLPALKVGGAYRAVVHRILSHRRVQLRIDGALLDARVETAVREGQELIVEVECLLPEVTFVLRRGGGKMLPTARQSLPGGPRRETRSPTRDASMRGRGR